ncbi:E3 ubiquitin-protein ligase TRIM71-like [Oculina patagonica]
MCFCLHCLEEILQTSGRHDIITCPECSIESRVPRSGNLSHLPTNFRINSLLDVLAIKECSTTGVKCGNCDKKSVQSLYCFQCSSFWCDNCITAHNIIRTNKQHRVLALKKFKDQDFKEVLKRPAFCGTPGHERIELEFFCKTCKVSICNACALTDHEGHAKMLMEKAANEQKLQVQSAIESQKKKAQQKRNKITELDEKCIHIEARAASVKRNVRGFVDFLMAVVEAKKREILNAVDIQVKESVERLQTQQYELSLNAIFQEEVSDEEEQVDSDLESLRRFVYEENETLIEKVVTEGIGSFKTFLSKACAQESSAEGKGISEATVAIGLEAELVLITRNAEGEQCYEERDSVTVQIRNQQGHDCATETRVQDYKDGTYKISYFAKETGECDISLKVNSEHACGSPFAVQVKPRQFRPVFSFGQKGSAFGMLDGLWGVAVNERNDIAVTETENQRVSVFSSDGTHLRSFGSAVSLPAAIDLLLSHL